MFLGFVKEHHEDVAEYKINQFKSPYHDIDLSTLQLN
jgi:hypothetical protein